MSYGLLWLEMLAVGLLFTGLLMTWGMRRRTRLARWSLWAVGFVPPAAVFVMLALATGSVAFMGRMNEGHFWWASELLTAYLIGVVVIRVRGGRTDNAGVRRALAWSPKRIGMGLLIVGLILIMTVWNLDLAARLEVQAIRTRAGALALSAEPIRVAETQNAAPLYGQLDGLYKAALLPEDEKADYAAMEAASPKLVAYLQRQEKALEMARRAADLPGYNVEPLGADLPKVIDKELSHLGVFRLASTLLTTAARNEAATGKVEMAVADCRRAYAVGNHVGSRSLMISGLVQVAVEYQANRSVGNVLPYVTSRGQLEGLKMEDAAAIREAYGRCLRSEEAFGLASFCDIATGEGAYQQMRGGTGAFMWQLWLKADMEIYRENLDACVELAKEPYYKTAAARGALEEEARPEKRRGLLSATIAPSLQKVASQFAEVEGLCLVAGEARALTLYRLEHGGYPEDTAALVPAYLAAVPTDPMDGKPLRYVKRSDGSVVIYSVGRDGKDDGGAVEKKDGKSATDAGVVLRMVGGVAP
jgi:hypothetical protein